MIIKRCKCGKPIGNVYDLNGKIIEEGCTKHNKKKGAPPPPPLPSIKKT
jgi:hypothetical protein